MEPGAGSMVFDLNVKSNGLSPGAVPHAFSFTFDRR